MMASAAGIHCPVCGSTDMAASLHIPDLPVHCNIQWPTYEKAVHAPKANLQLVLCEHCGHIFNSAFDSRLTAYSHHYENSLHFSPRFNAYATALATHLIEEHKVKNSTVIDIGCGKGDFLSLLCKLGNNRGYGFDPSFDPSRADVDILKQVTFVQDFYTEKHAQYKAALICCRHVLEHIYDPKQFLNRIRNAVINGNNPVLYFEVPNGLFILKSLAIWDLIYEHYSYFSPTSLTGLFRAAGFAIGRVYDDFDHQYLCIEVRTDGSEQTNTAQSRRPEELANYFSALCNQYDRKVTVWRNQLDEMKREGKRAVIWGAGSKGVTFLNMVQSREAIQYAVDLNPHKQTKFVAGTGQEIVSPDFLVKYRPDYVIVMNEIYMGEIAELLRARRITSEIVCENNLSFHHG
jgi:SAM-dependent methyltransferase